jgi:hypothetical protein
VSLDRRCDCRTSRSAAATLSSGSFRPLQLIGVSFVVVLGFRSMVAHYSHIPSIVGRRVGGTRTTTWWNRCGWTASRPTVDRRVSVWPCRAGRSGCGWCPTPTPVTARTSPSWHGHRRTRCCYRAVTESVESLTVVYDAGRIPTTTTPPSRNPVWGSSARYRPRITPRCSRCPAPTTCPSTTTATPA